MSRNTSNRGNTGDRVFGTGNTNRGSAEEEPSSDATHPYTIKTYTGNCRWAGTDANVFITLFGAEGVSEEIQLENSLDHSDPFEKANTDTFEVKAQPLGFVYKIKIRHDNSGIGPAWFLNKIEVICGKSEKKFLFKCYEWLFTTKKSKDFVLEHELEVESVPIIGVNPLVVENGSKHHTEKFKMEEETLIIRRGFSFNLSLKLARDYQTDETFYLTMKTGSRHRSKDKTLVTISEVLPKDFNDLKTKQEWGFCLRDMSDPKNILIEVFIPAVALPAKYVLVVDTDEETVCEPAFPVYVLFNPWCKEDEVYMEDETHVREYVMKQQGQVYVGSWRNPRPRQWHFGQFEEVSLVTAFKLLENKKAQDRDTAVEVSRIVSSMVNSNDNNGILVGNWSGEYDDGKSPTFWNSTTAILESFMKNGESVKYGQCWVFSCIVTTIMRALGIPCRSVTNFSSAHDSDGSCSNDKYYNKDGEPVEYNDSVWNFHVWNDAWMERPELPVGYGGWQAIDATPQERSQGLYQMGPCPLRAIKEGRIDLKYDTAFCLAEVNADTIYWKEQEDGEYEPVRRDRTSVGKSISTKAVGSNDRDDVTDRYKFAEGSVLERGAVRNALVKAGNKAIKETKQDIEVVLQAEKDEYLAGEDITLIVKLKNTSSEPLAIELAVAGQIVRYDGVMKAKLAKFKDNPKLPGNSERDIPIRVRAQTYLANVQDDTLLRFVACINVPTTGQSIVVDEVIDIGKPDLEFKNLPEVFKSGKKNNFFVTFQNPLEKELTNCEMYVDGTIIKNRIYMDKLQNVPAGEAFEERIQLIPDDVGGSSKKSIIVSFCCKQLGGLQCNIKVPVEG